MMTFFRFLDLSMAVSLFGVAHWFFGNVYEAVVYVPNLPIYFEGVMRSGHPLFAKGRPAPNRYYIPLDPLAVLMTWVTLLIGGTSLLPFARECLLAAALLLTVATALTAYIVVHVNLKLFYEVQTEMSVVKASLRRWSILNYVRITLVGSSLFLLFQCFRLLRGV